VTFGRFEAGGFSIENYLAHSLFLASHI
jgi:hypothetical protein